MRKVWGVGLIVCGVLTVVLLGGCAPAFFAAGVTNEAMSQKKGLEEYASQNAKNLNFLTYGTSKNFVLDIMGTKPFRVYRNKNLTVVNNPYKTESHEKNGKAIEIVYYITNIMSDDDNYTQEELTPLIFESGMLVGWGWKTLKAY
jgi:hypothetical protein